MCCGTLHVGPGDAGTPGAHGGDPDAAGALRRAALSVPRASDRLGPALHPGAYTLETLQT